MRYNLWALPFVRANDGCYIALSESILGLGSTFYVVYSSYVSVAVLVAS